MEHTRYLHDHNTFTKDIDILIIGIEIGKHSKYSL